MSYGPRISLRLVLTGRVSIIVSPKTQCIGATMPSNEDPRVGPVHVGSTIRLAYRQRLRKTQMDCAGQ